LCALREVLRTRGKAASARRGGLFGYSLLKSLNTGCRTRGIAMAVREGDQLSGSRPEPVVYENAKNVWI